jgi:ABC-2 type transport system permease protein
MSLAGRQTSETDIVAAPPAARVPFLLRSVGLKTLWDERRALFWWTLAAGVLSGLVVLLYPSIGAAPELEEMLERMPPAFRALMGEVVDIASPAGFVSFRVFSFIAPLVFLIYTIGRGTGAIAGEEQRGTLDLVLAHPVPRWRFVVEKFAALLIGGAVVGLGLWLGIVLAALAVNVELSFGRAAEATVAAVVFAYAHGALALALGAATGRTGLSSGVTAAVAIAGYLLHTLGLLVDWLEPFRILSPFYFYLDANPMLNGIDAGHLLVLALLTLAGVGYAAFAFQRRDVRL